MLKVKVFKVLGELVIIEGPPLLDLLTASLGSPAVNQGNYSNLNRLLKEAHSDIMQTSLDDMHIDMLGVGGGWVALVLSAVLARRVRDDQARRSLLPFLTDHHRPPALPVVRDDLPVVVPEHVGGVEIERPGLDDAGQVDGGALLDVELGGAEDGSHRLDDRKVDPVLQVRGRRHLKI